MHLERIELQPGTVTEMSIPEGFRMAGWVYILSNEYMPGIYKIGMTTTSPDIRAKELSSATGVPTPFNIEATFHCDDPAISERAVHDDLSNYRINESREFFKDDLDELVGICEQHTQANTKSSVQSLACEYDVISFESLNSLNLPALYEAIGIEVFGDNLAIAERLIRIGAGYVKSNLMNKGCALVLSENKAFCVEGEEHRFIREAEEHQEAYYQQLEAAGIYGPNKPVDI